MTEALTALDASQTKVAQLESQLADKDKIILEKVAAKAAATPVFNDTDVQSTLAQLQEMNIIDEPFAIKLAAQIKEDPRVMLGLLTKISEALLKAPVSGEGIEKEASADNVNPADPDGWGDFAAGRRVKLVR
jgi:hypothetical protein